VLILDLYFLQVGMQIGFEGLNLEVVAGDALREPLIQHPKLSHR
jgi:hypothetical protein